MGRQGHLTAEARIEDPTEANDLFTRLYEVHERLCELLGEHGKGPLGDNRSVEQVATLGEQGSTETELLEWVDSLGHMANACQMEGAEMMDWLPWKTWKTYPQLTPILAADIANEVAVEAIDMIHFCLNVLMLCGLNSRQASRLFMMKHILNRQRVAEEY